MQAVTNSDTTATLAVAAFRMLPMLISRLALHLPFSTMPMMKS